MTGARTDRELTGLFWAAVDRSELVRPVCADCGRSFFTPQVVCPHCQASGWTYQKSLGIGRVYSHTTVHRPPDPSFEPPYVIADVDVVEGWRMLTWIVNCEPDSVQIDMPVQVCFVPGADGELLPAFEPEMSP
jgi:uncharacterized OB-fold protein